MTKRKLAHRATIAVLRGVVVKNRIAPINDPEFAQLAQLAGPRGDLFVYDSTGLDALVRAIRINRR